MPVVSTIITSAALAVGFSATTAGMIGTIGAIGVYASVIGGTVYSMNRSNQSKKDQASAAGDARNKSLALAQEQKDAEAKATADAIESSKARRREVTQTIFSQPTDQYGTGSGGKTQLGVV